MQRRRLSPRAAVGVDVVIAVAVGTFGVWRESRQPADLDRLIALPLWARIGVQVAAAALLLRRRQQPLSVGIAIAGLCLLTPVQPPVIVVYSVAAHADRRRAAAAVIGLVSLCWCVGAQVWQLQDKLSGPIALAFAVVLGLYVRARRTLYDALLDRAERAERERYLLAERAVAEERSRLADEMHDVLSHRLTVLLLDAGVLSVTTADPVVRDAVERLRRHGVAALDDLRGIFGEMRADPATGTVTRSATKPRIDVPPIHELVDQWRAAGGRVLAEIDGDPAGLEPIVARTAYRVVQEGLTNAGKHAAGAAVRIEVRYTPAGATVTVGTDAASDGPAETVAVSGTGIAGLRQRVALVGGTLTAGPDQAGGFRLSAELPATVPGELVVPG